MSSSSAATTVDLRAQEVLGSSFSTYEPATIELEWPSTSSSFLWEEITGDELQCEHLIIYITDIPTLWDHEYSIPDTIYSKNIMVCGTIKFQEESVCLGCFTEIYHEEPCYDFCAGENCRSIIYQFEGDESADYIIADDLCTRCNFHTNMFLFDAEMISTHDKTFIFNFHNKFKNHLYLNFPRRFITHEIEE